jgi:hypothetical protein
MFTATPLIYCPKGIAKPACCAHGGAVGLLPGKGPDVSSVLEGDQLVTTGGGGLCYGGGWQPDAPGWTLTSGGWYVQLLGHRPQDLIRLQSHPRVRRWQTVVGAQPDQLWQIPVLLEHGGNGYTSALDGVWNGQAWTAGELADLQSQLLALVNGIGQGDPAFNMEQSLRDLAFALLAVGHWIDEPLLAVTGWFSEQLLARTILAATDQRLASHD